MPTILTAAEAAQVLRCEATDALMVALLPSVDAYIQNATGHDWAADSPVHPSAKAAARILMALWHENPAMVGNVGALPWGLTATLVQLEALALRYQVFEGLSSAGAIPLPGARRGDRVTELLGVVNVSGDQSGSFESVITYDDEIQQTSSSDLEEKFFRVLLERPA